MAKTHVHDDHVDREETANGLITAGGLLLMVGLILSAYVPISLRSGSYFLATITGVVVLAAVVGIATGFARKAKLRGAAQPQTQAKAAGR